MPFYKGVASADLKLILTVSGNIDSLTVTQSVDLCLTAGSQNFVAPTFRRARAGLLSGACDRSQQWGNPTSTSRAPAEPSVQFMELTHV